MVKGKERENEVEREGFGEYCYCMSKNGGFSMGSGKDYWFSSGSAPPEKVRICEINSGSDQITQDGSSGIEPQDADYSYAPSLNYELESLILARIPLSEYWKLSLLNRRYLILLKSGELFKIRNEIGVKESSVFMAAIGENSWWAFDREFNSRRKLPILHTDVCFGSGDKESFSAGTHLLVSGREFDGLVVWRYELAMNKWYKGPSMITPRCLFASATCGTFAFIAGGVGKEPNSEVYDSAEKYNPETKSWEPLPRMRRRRKLCSGCYMDNKFYVIGGRNQDGELTCGEFFDESRNIWILIPDMLKDDPVKSCHSPPLVAVVNNELYSLETSSNQLKVYFKGSNTWKQLGPVPVRADFNKGWGVAFKSLGNELLVIGASSVSAAGTCMTIYTCSPDLDGGELQWKLVNRNRNLHSHFILNCSVMVA